MAKLPEIDSDPIPNIPLLRKTVEWVEEQAALPKHKSRWRQSTWFHLWRLRPTKAHREAGEVIADGYTCRTRYCFAGKVVADAGWEPEWYSTYENDLEAEYVTKDGQRMEVMEAAKLELGLSAHGAWSLFHATNTAKDIRRIAEQIAGERL